MVKVIIDDAFMDEFNKAYGSRLGDPEFNLMFDTNQDGVIDMLDAIWFSSHRNQEVELSWISPTEPVPVIESTAGVLNPDNAEMLRGLHEIFKNLTKSQMEYLAQLLTPLQTIAALMRNIQGGGGAGVTPTSVEAAVASCGASMEMYSAIFTLLQGKTTGKPQTEA
jgi:hypothetical protein